MITMIEASRNIRMSKIRIRVKKGECIASTKSINLLLGWRKKAVILNIMITLDSIIFRKRI